MVILSSQKLLSRATARIVAFTSARHIFPIGLSATFDRAAVDRHSFGQNTQSRARLLDVHFDALLLRRRIIVRALIQFAAAGITPPALLGGFCSGYTPRRTLARPAVARRRAALLPAHG
jgi:hypothetical protein